jgi:ATP-binding cassette subfamily F protein 3
LSLAILVQSGANVLIHDEPTNHLDLESREALEQALDEFPGSLLLVSHDRALLDAVGTRTVAVEDRTLHSYVGGWPEYVRVREERAAAKREAASAPELKRAKPSQQATVPKAKPKPAVNGGQKQRRLEAEIEAAEAALKALEDELADPAAWATPDRSADSTRRHEQAKRAIEELYARWEAVAG